MAQFFFAQINGLLVVMGGQIDDRDIVAFL